MITIEITDKQIKDIVAKRVKKLMENRPDYESMDKRDLIVLCELYRLKEYPVTWIYKEK
jgi:hypothetical protein